MPASEKSHVTPARSPRPPPEPSTIVLVLGGPISRTDLERLCERVRAFLESSDADLVLCDVGALVYPDCVTVDALARLQLTARRLRRQVQLLEAPGELRDLLSLTGLSDVVPVWAGLPLELRGQAEQREQTRGVEEEGDPVDPIA